MIFPYAGVTSQSIDIQIVDDSGLAVTGLVAATFPTLTYSVNGVGADVAFPTLTDLAALTTAYASGGVKERGGGFYRTDLPNGVFTALGIVRVRGEASGKHVLCPPIDVGVTDALMYRGLAAAITALGEPNKRSLLSVIREHVNHMDTTSVAGQVIVTKEDDATEAYRKSYTTDAAAILMTSQGGAS